MTDTRNRRIESEKKNGKVEVKRVCVGRKKGEDYISTHVLKEVSDWISGAKGDILNVFVIKRS